MASTTQIVYWGALDEYHHDELDLHFFRGVPTEVPAEHVGRFLRAQRDRMNKVRPESRDFFRADEPVPDRVHEAYLAYPDRVIADMQKHAKAYQRIHDLVDDEDDKRAAAKRKGAQEEIDYAEGMIEDHRAMKKARLENADVSPTVKRRKAEAVA